RGSGRVRHVCLSVGAVVTTALWCLSTAITTTGSPATSGQTDGDGYILLDESATVLEVDPRAETLLSAVDLTPGAELPAVLPETEPIVSEGQPAEQTITSGERAVRARLEPLSNDGHQLLVLQAARTDLLEALPDHTVILDASGRITFADPTFEDELDCPPASLVGSQLESEIHPEEVGELRQILTQLRAEPDTQQRFEFRIQTSTGEWRVLEAAGRNLCGYEPIDGIVLNCRDVTDRKQRENILQEQKQRLERFAEIVSHDLRSPLQVATGHLERAAETGNEAAFQKVRQAHDRIDTIIGDVLTLARQGENAQETETVSLELIAREAWDTVETAEMTLDIRADREVEADPDRLQQLFENLFRNAVEHAGEDVTVTVGPVDPMHTSTRIGEQLPSGFYVADDGPGIDDAHKKTVFDSGFTTESDGTGFGLAIVAQIADAHQWNVEVLDSRTGGARFEFTDQPADERLKPS
ncbi:MAG: two-component system sensor histidine kinase NtrB, partial [Halovenus sp.]